MPTTMLHVTMDSVQVDAVQIDTLDMSVARMYDLQPRKPLAADHDYADMPNKTVLSQYKQAVIAYMAGYVVKMVKRKIKCVDCQLALKAEPVTTSAASNNVGNDFMVMKDRGGLIKASSSVIVVCQETEKCFQRMHAAVGDKLPQKQNILSTICY